MQVRITLDNDVSYDLYNDLGWLVDFESMDAPSPKTNYVDIPARSGYLDLTEVDGTIYYNAIEFTLVCKRICRKSPQILSYSREMMNLFNGKTARVYLDNDEYYYDSRLAVTNFYRDGLTIGLEILVTAYPYRLQEEMTTRTFNVSGTQNITLTNGVMPVVPTISASSAMTITYGSSTFNISSGDNIMIPNLVLQDGENSLSVSGTGTLTFTYQQGAF